LFVMEPNRFEREDRFARPLHRLDPFLEALRRNPNAELAGGIHLNGNAHNSDTADTSDVRSCLRRFGTDPDGVGLASNTLAAYIDFVVTRGKIATCKIPQCDVAGAGCIIQERIVPGGRVAVAGCVGKKRKITNCRVVWAGCVGKESETTGSCVPDGGRV